MLAIDVTAGIIAISVLFGIFQYLKRTAGPARWADSRRSHHLQQVRENLLAADEEFEHPRNWRPQILAIFSNNTQRHEQLLHFASWIQGGSGLITGVRIIEGEGLKMLKFRKELEDEMRKEIAALRLKAFPLVLLAPSSEVGLLTLIQAYGIGPIRANTILLSFQDEFSENIPSFKKTIHFQNIRTIFRMKCNIVMLNAEKQSLETLESMPPEKRRIDVWWRNDATSHLMLMLAYLMTREAKWTEARIRVIAVCYDEKSEKNIEDLEHTLEEIRIEAAPEILDNPTAASIKQYSEDAAMVFLPFQLQGRQISGPFGLEAEELLAKLPLSAMVLASEDIDLNAEPEEGRPQEIAEALDALDEALKRSHETEKNAEKAVKAALDAEKKLNEIMGAAKPGFGKEIMERIEKAAKAADVARERAETAFKKAARAQAKTQQVAHEAEALGVGPIEKEEQSSEPPESNKNHNR